MTILFAALLSLSSHFIYIQIGPRAEFFATYFLTACRISTCPYFYALVLDADKTWGKGKRNAYLREGA